MAALRREPTFPFPLKVVLIGKLGASEKTWLLTRPPAYFKLKNIGFLKGKTIFFVDFDAGNDCFMPILFLDGSVLDQFF